MILAEMAWQCPRPEIVLVRMRASRWLPLT